MKTHPNLLPPAFGPTSRTGFEVELLAPVGCSRFDVARALAAEIGGRVLYEYKSETLRPQGAHDELRVNHGKVTPSARVLSAKGEWFCSLVDDASIDIELDGSETAYRYWYASFPVACLAGAAARSISPKEDDALLRDRDAALASLKAFFDAGWSASDAPQQFIEGRYLVDDRHETVGIVAGYPESLERVCEIVTAPLARAERFEVLALIFRVAKRLGLSGPPGAGVHVHIDGPPWMSTYRLKRLVQVYQQSREAVLEALAPAASTSSYRGAFSRDTIAYLSSLPDSTPFDEVRAGLLERGQSKSQDVNLLGILHQRAPQQTVELRVFPPTIDAELMREKLEWLEALLATACVP